MSTPARDERDHYERIYTVVEQVPHGQVATYGDIATIVGCSERAVQRWRRRTGHIVHEAPARHDPSVKRRAGQLLDDGCHPAEVARTLGICPTTVKRWFPEAHRMSRAEVAAWMRMHRQAKAAMA